MPKTLLIKQIDDDYDIFIGIMWSRFGTPTHRDTSGTKEEFERAYRRFKNNEPIQILFYFKKAPIALEDIDTEQISNVKKFRAEISDKGTFWFQFDDTLQLKKLLRIHIHNAVLDLHKIHDTILSEKNSTPNVINTITQPEEKGIFEQLPIINENIILFTEALVKMTNYITDMTNDLETSTKELNILKTGIDEENINEITFRKYVEIVDHLSYKMIDFANKTNNIIPIYRIGVEKGLNAYLELYVNYFSKYETHNKDEHLDNIKKIFISIPNSLQNMLFFRKNIQEFPPMTTPLNKAKHEVIVTLNNLIREFEFTIELLEDINYPIYLKITPISTYDSI